jgi:tetratricopeptide (TPR) repeat protein
MIQPIVTLLNAERFDQAESGLTELLAARPDHPEGLHLYGLLLCQTAREEQGIETLRRATAAAPKIALYWNNLAAALSRAALLEDSALAARKAVELEPNYAEARRTLANVLLATDDLAGGIIQLESICKLLPADVAAWHRLGQCYAEQARFDAAEAAYKKALGLEPENTAVMRDLSTLYTNNWRYDDAQLLRRRADQLDKVGNA